VRPAGARKGAGRGRRGQCQEGGFEESVMWRAIGSSQCQGAAYSPAQMVRHVHESIQLWTQVQTPGPRLERSCSPSHPHFPYLPLPPPCASAPTTANLVCRGGHRCAPPPAPPAGPAAANPNPHPPFRTPLLAPRRCLATCWVRVVVVFVLCLPRSLFKSWSPNFCILTPSASERHSRHSALLCSQASYNFNGFVQSGRSCCYCVVCVQCLSGVRFGAARRRQVTAR
jgi:hypothetical protein